MALAPLIPELQAAPDPEGDALYSAQLLIGCVLTEPRRYREVVFVKPHHFNHPGFETVWRTLENFDAAGRTLETGALIDAIGGLPEMEDFGGREGLRDLFLKSRNPAMVRDHADAVLDA